MRFYLPHSNLGKSKQTTTHSCLRASFPNNNKACETFVFPAIEPDAPDLQGAHLLVFIATARDKSIQVVDINGEAHDERIDFLAEALNHYHSLGNRRNPWRKSSALPVLPIVVAEEQVICADFALIILENFVRAGELTSLAPITSADISAFRTAMLRCFTPTESFARADGDTGMNVN